MRKFHSIDRCVSEILEARRLLSVSVDLDPTFGHAGIAPLPISGFAVQQTLAQPDGKLLIDGSTGDFEHATPTLLRLNADGTRDQTFGGGDGQITLLRGAMRADSPAWCFSPMAGFSLRCATRASMASRDSLRT